MDKLKINLIPPEIREKAKKEAKRSVLARISVGLLGLLILLTSGLLALIIFQNVTLQNLTREIDQERSKIVALKDKEVAVFFLKNRLNSINKFSSSNTKQGQNYDLINSLFPTGADLTSVQIDKTDKILLTGETTSAQNLDLLFDNLTDPKMNEGKIASVLVDSLSRTPNGIIRFNLSINMKGGTL